MCPPHARMTRGPLAGCVGTVECLCRCASLTSSLCFCCCSAPALRAAAGREPTVQRREELRGVVRGGGGAAVAPDLVVEGQHPAQEQQGSGECLPRCRPGPNAAATYTCVDSRELSSRCRARIMCLNSLFSPNFIYLVIFSLFFSSANHLFSAQSCSYVSAIYIDKVPLVSRSLTAALYYTQRNDF